MKQVSVDFSAKEAEELAGQLVARLDEPAKLRLVHQLERQTRRRRWEPLVTTMRRRFAKHPLTALQIRRLCEQVRQEHFETRQRAARRH
jgi:hypothetical protein